MDDTEIRLHCVEAAGGNLSIARQIYNWVMGREEPLAGGQLTVVTPYPLKGSAADCAIGSHVAGTGGLAPFST